MGYNVSGHFLSAIFPPVPRSRRHRLRVLAALLAWVSLLALPTRVLAECPMLGAGDVAAGHHVAGDSMPEAHETHGADGGPAVSGAPAAPDAPAPEHTSCPDLAHCAVAAVPSPHAQPAIARGVAGDLVMPVPAAPLAPARGIEPPPPKA